MAEVRARTIEDDGERMIPEFHHDTLIYAEHMVRYLFASRFVAGKRVLDVGSGVGYGSDMLKAAGAAEVIGIDRSTEAITYGRERHADFQPDYLLGDAESLPLRDRQFDVVVSFETIEHVLDYQLFLTEIQRVLRRGGLLIISTPNKAIYPEGNPFHLKEFIFTEFEEVLKSYFKNVTILGQDNWSTSAVLPGKIMQKSDAPLRSSLKAYKAASREPTETLYMVGLCSDGPLSKPDPHIVLTHVPDSELFSQEMTRRDVEIQRQRMELTERDSHLADKDAALAEKDAALTAKEAALAQGKKALQQARRELAAIHQSLGYRLLQAYRRRMRWLFPRGSWRGRPYRAAVGLIRLLLPSTEPGPGIGPPRRALRLATRSVHIVRTEGWRAFLRKTRQRLTTGYGDGRHYAEQELSEEVRPLIFPSPGQPTVSIVIPVHNKSLYTFNCLASIQANTEGPSYEVILVDDASTDDTQSMLRQVQNVRVVRNPENLGFVDSCNKGAALASGQYLLLLNNDTKVHKGWLRALVEAIERDDSVGLVGAKLVFPDGRLQEAGGIIWRDASGWNYGRHDDPEEPEYNYLREVDYCSGACFLVRRDLFERAGGFDHRYAPAYYEDTDLAFTVRQMGFKVIYQPEAVITHFEGVTAGTDTSSGMKRYQEINRAKFFEKWKEVLERHHLPNARDILLARDRGDGPRALVIDHQLPSYDRDSGSLRMHQILKFLVEFGFILTFIPDNLARIAPYTHELQQMGIETLYGPKDIADHIKGLGRHLKLCLLSRPDVAEKYVPLIRKFAPEAVLIYDTVDLHFVREQRRAEVEKSKSAKKTARRYRDLELALVRGCDATIAVTETEKELLETEIPGAKVHVIPNIHETRSGGKPSPERQGLLFVGSFTHPPNRDAAAYFVREIFPLIKREIPDVTCWVVGSDPTDDVKALACRDVIVTGWVQDLAPQLESCRVFVAPLRYGAGLKGKIGQSMGFGLPVVTTSIGVEGTDLVDGTDVLIADEPADFARKVIKVYQDEELWRQISERSVRYVEEHYSPEVVKAKLRAILSESAMLRPTTP